VEAGDKHTGKHISAGVWQLLDGMPRELWTDFILGDVSFGSEAVMHEAEERNIHYLDLPHISAPH